MPHECTTCGRTFPDGSKEMLSGCPNCGGNKFQFHPGGTSSSGATESPGSESSTPPDHTPPDHTTPGDDDAPLDSPPGPGSAPPTDSSFTFGSSRSGEAGVAPPSGSASADPDSASPGTIERDSATIEDDLDPIDSGSDLPPEDRAQASARSTVVSDDELPQTDSGQDSPPETVDSPPPENRDADAPDDPLGGHDRNGVSTESSDDHAEGTDASDSPDLSELREELNDQFESIKIHARGEYELNLMELYDREEHIIALQEDGRYVIDVPGSWREGDEES
jgi:predicted  nucleic acid-binding Zn-ribbon protein